MTDTRRDRGPAVAVKRMPRQKRAKQTRARLLEMGLDAFSRLGHDGTNLHADILRPAGISVGSFYHQFADKTDLMLAVMGVTGDRRRLAVLGGAMTEMATADNGEASFRSSVATAMRIFFDGLDDPSQGWRLVLNERSTAEPRIRAVALKGREKWIAQLAEVIAQRTGAPAGLCQLAAENVVSLAVGLAASYLDLPPQRRSEHRQAFLDSATEFVASGVLGLLDTDRG